MPPHNSVPGLFYEADWLSVEACDTLLASIDAEQWSTALRRRVQHYGHRYDYGRRSVADNTGASTAPSLPQWARALAERLVEEGFMEREPDQAIINEYQPGQGISPHVDCLPCFGPVVAAVSLGSACVMDFTQPDAGVKVAVPLAPGGLCVMTGPARDTWHHGIAARRSDQYPEGRVLRGRRVSVTYRTVVGTS